MNVRAYVYILANKKNGTLYVGMTNDLVRRVWEHSQGESEGFTSRYGIHQPVYFEEHRSMVEAIRREKQLKKWNGAWKVQLIERENPHWTDLYDSFLEARGLSRA